MKTKTVKTVLSVYNATNLIVHAHLSGFDHGLESLFATYHTNPYNIFKPKSFTLVYEHNSAQTKDRLISIGERQTNDKLLYTASKLVTTTSRFAEDDFQYEDELKSISCIEFSFDVSEHNSILVLKTDSD